MICIIMLYSYEAGNILDAGNIFPLQTGRQAGRGENEIRVALSLCLPSISVMSVLCEARLSSMMGGKEKVNTGGSSVA